MRWDRLSYFVGVLLLCALFYLLFYRAATEAQIGGLLIYGAVVFVLALFAATFFVFGYGLRPKHLTRPDQAFVRTDVQPA
jgi:hypothetical protein